VSYQIEVTTPAKAELQKLTGYVRAQAYQMIDTLASNPRPHKAKELRGKPGFYRIWLAGRWCIVYTIDDDLQTVTILRVRSKQQIDYENL
jgi:addiction module RelE/StbE family toxin